jgi:hypothetical protein
MTPMSDTSSFAYVRTSAMDGEATLTPPRYFEAGFKSALYVLQHR